jgi:hypothetical protein
MTDSEVLIGLAGAALSIFSYFAGVRWGKRYRQAGLAERQAEREGVYERELGGEREERIRRVVGRYRDLVNRAQSSSLKGLLTAGVLGLHNSEEVGIVCRMIEAQGLPPGIPATCAADLEGADLLMFFRLLKGHADEARDEAGLRQLARKAKVGGGAWLSGLP